MPLSLTELIANWKAKIPFATTSTPTNQKLLADELVTVGTALEDQQAINADILTRLEALENAAPAPLAYQFMTVEDSLGDEGYQSGAGDPYNLAGFYSPLSWRGEMQLLLPSTYQDFRGWNKSGAWLDTLQAQYTPNVSPALSEGAYTERVLFIGGIINGVLAGGQTPLQMYNRLKTYITGAKTDHPGLLVLVPTVTPVNITGQTNGNIWGSMTQEELADWIEEFNNRLRTGQTDLQVDGIPEFWNDGVLGDAFDTTVYHDGLHFLEAGNQRKAVVVKDVLLAVISASGPVAVTPVAYTPPGSEAVVTNVEEDSAFWTKDVDALNPEYISNDSIVNSGGQARWTEGRVSKNQLAFIPHAGAKVEIINGSFANGLVFKEDIYAGPVAGPVVEKERILHAYTGNGTPEVRATLLESDLTLEVPNVLQFRDDNTNPAGHCWRDLVRFTNCTLLSDVALVS